MANKAGVRKIAGLLLWFCCALLAVAMAGQPVPELNRRVTDLTATLSVAQLATLEQRLQAFEQQKGSQIAVLIVPSTQPEDIAEYAMRVVERWQLGRKGTDDGILVLIAKEDRAARIEVGYGLEGIVPDAVAKRIIEDVMVPYFRNADYAVGINVGVEKLIALIQGEALPAPQHRFANGDTLNDYVPFLLVLAFAGGGIARAVLGRLLGGLIIGGIVGTLVWVVGGSWLFALLLGFVVFLVTVSNSRGGFRGGGFSSGGFSGGSGGFGGGGASGRW